MDMSDSPGRPVFKKLTQVGLVVRNVEATARRYWEDFGIGPWNIYLLDPANTPNMTLRGKPVIHAFRAALATVGDLSLELIEPLSGDSIYAEHLMNHGEGLHHLAFDVESFEQTREQLRRKGYAEVQSGRPFGLCNYIYVDTQRDLAILTELGLGPPSGQSLPDPESTVP
jgi:glyoxalase/bleomycin resistance protein/dioxygenase superfamily protein